MKVKAALGQKPAPPDPAVRLRELTAIMDQITAILDTYQSTIEPKREPLDITAFGDTRRSFLLPPAADRYSLLRSEIAVVSKTVAEKKANDLLDRHLTKEQLSSLNRYGWFEAKGQKMTYRIQCGRARQDDVTVFIADGFAKLPEEAQPYLFDRASSKGIFLCVYVSGPGRLPVADQVLAMKLGIEKGEKDFLNKANPFSSSVIKIKPDGTWQYPKAIREKPTQPVFGLYARRNARPLQATQIVHAWDTDWNTTTFNATTTITTNTTNTNEPR